MIHIYDVIVVGAGPAGLAAGVVLKDTGKDYLILEKGNDLIKRDSSNPKDVSSGIGGCGLFSDGKLSFSPSASYLWTQLNEIELEESFKYIWDIFHNLNLDIPEWTVDWISKSSDNEVIADNYKNYLSITLNSFMRSRILNYFYDKNISNIKQKCCVSNIVRIKDYYEISTLDSETYFARNIIITTGKFGSKIFHNKDSNYDGNILNKLELGVRLETESDSFKPYSSPNADFKLIEQIEKDVEFRTFCCCKDGMVIMSKFDDFVSFNGAKTQFLTHKSNIGLLVRSSAYENDYYKEMSAKLSSEIKPFKVSVEEFLSGDSIYIGEKCDKLLRERISTIIDISVDTLKNTFIYGPEIEYIGGYLNCDNSLKICNDIWLAGDITGKFRGLMAALVSGIYTANEINHRFEKNIQRGISKLGIKVSNAEKMDLIFTAQSKNYFYCKDVICEYVLKQKKVPINPFMVFNYFLNDRVDRNLVRQGNNQLIQSCKELWVFGPIADGVLFEIALAKLNGKPIRFFKLGTRIHEINEINDIDKIAFEPEVHSRQIKKSDLINFIRNSNVDDGQLALYMNL